jgi:hypothetical protein
MKKKCFSALCLSIIACTCLAACGTTGSTVASGSNAGSTESEAYNTFSWWMPYTTNNEFFDNYSDNPHVKYITGRKYGPNNSSIKFNFDCPPTDSLESSFNTAMAAGDLEDIFSTMIVSARELYKNNYIMDLTNLVAQYAPNYKNFIETDSYAKDNAYVSINGEKKILQIDSYGKNDEQWEGYCYRRDWLAKYGTNPKTGVAFTGSWNGDNWTDDVVFPNGGSDPIYISDWEWMMGIFKKALAGESISNGYVTTLYYPGFLGTGDLVSAFGGGGPQWYKHDDTVYFGGTSNNFRYYLEAMSTWYKNGWIDTRFAERTSDMFYNIDANTVLNGKVGLWLGMPLYLGKGMQDTCPGSCVYPARPPINNIYGDDAAKNVTPYCFYQTKVGGMAIALNSKCADNKNVPAFLSMINYLYTDEGSQLGLGLTKAQYEECKDPLYTKYGLTDGAYKWVDSTGADWVEGTSTGTKMYKVNPILAADSDMSGQLTKSRIPYRNWGTEDKYPTDSALYVKGQKEWTTYKSSGDVSTLSKNSDVITDAETTTMSKAMTSANEFMNKNTPTMINGTRDPFSDTVWANYVNGLNKYKVNEVTALYQKALDALK